MRYGIWKKLTTKRFWMINILIQLIAGIVVDWFFRISVGVPLYDISRFVLFWALRVFGYALGTILVYKFFKKDCLFDDDTVFDEVKREVKKNKYLYEKIEAIENTRSWDYPTDYPPRRAILLNYAKRNKLKDYEKDYTRYILEFSDDILKKVQNGTW